MRDDQFEQGGTQPCFTNPEVKRLIIDGILGRLARQGQADGNIAISQNDNTKYCRCDRCKAIDDREESHMGALLTLVNEAADTVARERPGVFVGTLAYQFSRTPPKSLKPRPNVAIQLCSIEACQIHPLDDPNCPKNVPISARTWKAGARSAITSTSGTTTPTSPATTPPAPTST